jgi:hypothetical protein
MPNANAGRESARGGAMTVVTAQEVADALTPPVQGVAARDQGDIEIEELPSPTAAFVLKFLPKILSNTSKFLGYPNKKSKKKDSKLYLSDLCDKYGLAKTGKRKDLEKRLLAHFFKVSMPMTHSNDSLNSLKTMPPHRLRKRSTFGQGPSK